MQYLELLISEDLGRPRQDSWSLLTSQFVTQSYQRRATNLVNLLRFRRCALYDNL